MGPRPGGSRRGNAILHGRARRCRHCVARAGGCGSVELFTWSPMRQKDRAPKLPRRAFNVTVISLLQARAHGEPLRRRPRAAQLRFYRARFWVRAPSRPRSRRGRVWKQTLKDESRDGNNSKAESLRALFIPADGVSPGDGPGVAHAPPRRAGAGRSYGPVVVQPDADLVLGQRRMGCTRLSRFDVFARFRPRATRSAWGPRAQR